MRLEPIAIPDGAERVLAVLRAHPGPVPGDLLRRESGLDERTCAAHLACLGSLGYEIAELPDGSYRLAAAPDRLLPNEVRRHAQTRWLGAHLQCFDEVDSTNTVARDLARAGAREGTVVIADAQRRGRGRLGRTWISPPRCNLYASVVLRPALPAAALSRISLVAGVAACDAVGEWHPAAIKWPNDVLIDGRKVAGILTEMEGEEAECFVVVGIGVNLNAEAGDFPPDLRDTAGSVRLATGAPVDRPRFAGRLLAHLEGRYDQLRREGFAPIAAAWHERSCLTGRPIVVRAPEGEISGMVLGLDQDGALRLRLPSGAEHRVVAGDVTVLGGYARRAT